ncbi:Nif3-like dinuclear metal center hexameric protein [Paenibacillus thermoaerophilus]|uniref:GTP cyclohydrolase 1 type 2 homolog n=1 Tax=Paenibacillus thermoaerophilus TaxID=1215385 RepID=A0ABW2UZD8_9BACL|nr:Nif3-like dinuclear metal center hexameric protein [Paenibacillus thermoaerophilus]TMV19041.1 Nif3-like dinuclear metal center hexameric protein [Paenibacillus thermoaerophilus]
MFAKGAHVVQLIERLAPKHLAVPDDKIGLQLGTLAKEVRRVLVTLDVTPAVVEEAIGKQADLIVAHHAIIFRPLAHLQTDTPAGRLYERLIKHDIAVYIAHTNYDIAEGGMNDLMADALGLTETTHLSDVHTEKLKKLVVFVPESHHEPVLQAMFRAGAGWIGNYSHCSFNIEGTGTFLPQDGARPFIGEPGKLERAAEIRVETIVPESAEKRVVQAMLKAHPYEEVAYDLYPMDLKGRSFGLGRVGKLPEPEPLSAFAKRVKASLNVESARVTGDPDKPIRKVAVLGGSGSRYVRQAQMAGADVIVTGDIDFHTAQDALAAGMAIVDPGHHAEKMMIQPFAAWLNEQLKQAGTKTEALPSETDTNPFWHV